MVGRLNFPCGFSGKSYKWVVTNDNLLGALKTFGIPSSRVVVLIDGENPTPGTATDWYVELLEGDKADRRLLGTTMFRIVTDDPEALADHRHKNELWVTSSELIALVEEKELGA